MSVTEGTSSTQGRDSVDTSQDEIVLRDLHKSFRGGRDRVLQGLNLTLKRGTLTYVLGPSGVGKSVLLKHVLGLLRPDRGQVWVRGQDLATLSSRELTVARTQFGVLFQNSALFDDLSVFENVAFPLWEHTELGRDAIRERVESSLQRLGMAGGYDKFPNELSGGMRKRVGLARAIVREPKILLYDEPTTGLDPVTRTTVDALIGQLKRELRLTSLVISHDVPSALLWADRIAFVALGQIAFFGSASEFVRSEHPEVRRFLEAERRTLQALEQVGFS